jgi:hypothetical protein
VAVLHANASSGVWLECPVVSFVLSAWSLVSHPFYGNDWWLWSGANTTLDSSSSIIQQWKTRVPNCIIVCYQIYQISGHIGVMRWLRRY